MSKNQDKTKVSSLHLYTALLAALPLLSLLPIGYFIGTSSNEFQLIFLCHIILHIVSLVLSLKVLVRMARLSLWPTYVPILTLIPFLLSIIIFSSFPVVNQESLSWHLFVGKTWSNAAEIIPLRWHERSFFPSLIQLAYTGLYNLELESLATLYHASYLLLIASGLAWFQYQRTKDASSAIGLALIAFTMPYFMRIAVAPLHLLPLIFFCTCALLLLTQWMTSEKGLLPLLGASASLGFALSCDYIAIAFAIVFFTYLFLGGLACRTGFWRILAASLLVPTVAILSLAPWFVKNLLFTSNPVFPLLKNMLGGTSVDISYGNTVSFDIPGRLTTLLQDPIHYALYPIRMVLDGNDHVLENFDGVLSPIILIALFSILRLKQERWLPALIFSMLLYLAGILLAKDPVLATVAPILGAALMLAGIGFQAAQKLVDKKLKGVLFSGLLIMHLGLSMLYSWQLFQDFDGSSVLSGVETADDFKHRYISEYQLIKKINAELPENAYVYLLYTSNAFSEYRPRVFAGDEIEPSLFDLRLQSTRDERFVALSLIHQGITHILAHRDQLESHFEFSLGSETSATWEALRDNYLEPLYDHGEFTLFRIKELDSAAEQEYYRLEQSNGNTGTPIEEQEEQQEEVIQ